MTKKDLAVSSFIGLSIAVLFLIVSQSVRMRIPYPFLTLLLFPALSAAGTTVAAFLGKKIPAFFQLAKFLLVGAFNTFVDLGILNVLIATSGISTGLIFSLWKAISFLGAVGNSYVWNRYWSFSAPSATPKEQLPQEFGKFLVVSLVGFALNVGVASFVVNILGPQFEFRPTLLANLGALLATVASMTWNFLGYKLVVFKR